MRKLPRDAEKDTHMTGSPPGAGSTNTPRWVKVFGIIAIVLVLLIVIMMLTGHDPGRHIPSGDAGDYTSPSTVLEDRTSPEGDQ